MNILEITDAGAQAMKDSHQIIAGSVIMIKWTKIMAIARVEVVQQRLYKQMRMLIMT